MRVYVGIPRLEALMTALLTQPSDSEQAKGKTVFRNTTRCLKLTKQEAQLLDQFATARGMARSEWMRDVILRELHGGSVTDPSLAEILGVRLLLVNVLRPLAAGQKLAPEAFDKLLDDIGDAKHQLAAKLATLTGRK